MERNFQRMPVNHGIQVIESKRGISSHQYNPMMILAERSACEDYGSCYAMSFVYSGSFKGEAEKDQYNQTRVMLGLNDDGGMKIPGKRSQAVCAVGQDCLRRIKYLSRLQRIRESLSDVYSVVARDQGRVLYDYVLGLYDFLERLLDRYPAYTGVIFPWISSITTFRRASDRSCATKAQAPVSSAKGSDNDRLMEKNRRRDYAGKKEKEQRLFSRASWAPSRRAALAIYGAL